VIGVILGMVAAAAFVMRALLPWLLRQYTEPRILQVALFTAAFAYLMLPAFSNAYALAAITFVLGLGVGCAQPLSTSLLYALAPSGRIAEAIGVHRTVRNSTQLLIPIIFGSVGSAFGFATVFLSNSAVLAAGGVLFRKLRAPDHVIGGKRSGGTQSR
jgi:MFS family permease